MYYLIRKYGKTVNEVVVISSDALENFFSGSNPKTYRVLGRLDSNLADWHMLK